MNRKHSGNGHGSFRKFLALFVVCAMLISTAASVGVFAEGQSDAPQEIAAETVADDAAVKDAEEPESPDPEAQDAAVAGETVEQSGSGEAAADGTETAETGAIAANSGTGTGGTADTADNSEESTAVTASAGGADAQTSDTEEVSYVSGTLAADTGSEKIKKGEDGSDLRFDAEAEVSEAAALPEGAVFSAEEVLADAEYKSYTKRAEDVLSALYGTDEEGNTARVISSARFFDLGFTADGVEVEPADKVIIRLAFYAGLEFSDGDEVVVLHFDEKDARNDYALDETASKITAKVENEVLTEISFKGDQFSVYGIVVVSPVEEEAESAAANEIGKETRSSLGANALYASSDSTAVAQDGTYSVSVPVYNKSGTQTYTVTLELVVSGGKITFGSLDQGTAPYYAMTYIANTWYSFWVNVNGRTASLNGLNGLDNDSSVSTGSSSIDAVSSASTGGTSSGSGSSSSSSNYTVDLVSAAKSIISNAPKVSSDSSSANETVVADGTYKGSATVGNYTLGVIVTVSGGKITAVENDTDVTSTNGDWSSMLSTSGSQYQLEKYIGQSASTATIDAISGATTSGGSEAGYAACIRNAISNALSNGATSDSGSSGGSSDSGNSGTATSDSGKTITAGGSATINVGETINLTGSHSSTSYGDTWTSSNTSVATVAGQTYDYSGSEKATVTGVGAGTVTITHTISGGGIWADTTETYTITVSGSSSGGNTTASYTGTITSPSSLTSGDYIIVSGRNTSYAMSGTSGGSSSGGYYLTGVSCTTTGTTSDSTATVTDASAVWTYDSSTGSFKNKSTGDYLNVPTSTYTSLLSSSASSLSIYTISGYEGTVYTPYSNGGYYLNTSSYYNERFQSSYGRYLNSSYLSSGDGVYFYAVSSSASGSDTGKVITYATDEEYTNVTGSYDGYTVNAQSGTEVTFTDITFTDCTYNFDKDALIIVNGSTSGSSYTGLKERVTTYYSSTSGNWVTTTTAYGVTLAGNAYDATAGQAFSTTLNMSDFIDTSNYPISVSNVTVQTSTRSGNWLTASVSGTTVTLSGTPTSSDTGTYPLVLINFSAGGHDFSIPLAVVVSASESSEPNLPDTYGDTASQISVTKEWDDSVSDDDKADTVTIRVQSADGSDIQDVSLTSTYSWTGTVTVDSDKTYSVSETDATKDGTSVLDNYTVTIMKRTATTSTSRDTVATKQTTSSDTYSFTSQSTYAFVYQSNGKTYALGVDDSGNIVGLEVDDMIPLKARWQVTRYGTDYYGDTIYTLRNINVSGNNYFYESYGSYSLTSSSYASTFRMDSDGSLYRSTSSGSSNYMVAADGSTISGTTSNPGFAVFTPYLIGGGDVTTTTTPYTVTNAAKDSSSDDPTTVSDGDAITVTKSWADGTTAASSVVATIAATDGSYSEDVTLNSSNNWTATVSDLDSTKTYTITEKSVDGSSNVTDDYTVTITTGDDTYVEQTSGSSTPTTTTTGYTYNYNPSASEATYDSSTGRVSYTVSGRTFTSNITIAPNVTVTFSGCTFQGCGVIPADSSAVAVFSNRCVFSNGEGTSIVTLSNNIFGTANTNQTITAGSTLGSGSGAYVAMPTTSNGYTLQSSSKMYMVPSWATASSRLTGTGDLSGYTGWNITGTTPSTSGYQLFVVELTYAKSSGISSDTVTFRVPMYLNVGGATSETKVTTYHNYTITNAAKESEVSEPDHTKSISSQNSDGSYTLSLNMKGVGKTTSSSSSSTTTGSTPADILIILDQTGSISYYSSYENDLKTAAKAFVDGLPTNSSSNIALITFGERGYYNAAPVVTNQSWTALTASAKTSLDSKIDALAYDANGINNNSGGTSYTEALNTASTMLGNASNTKKYVVFFTDGDADFNTTTEITNAASSVKAQATVYAVGAGSWVSNTEKLGLIPSDSSKLYTTTSTSGLTTEFNNILQSITSEITTSSSETVMSGLVIQDTLSEYVDLADSTSPYGVTVTKTASDGTVSTLTYGSFNDYTVSYDSSTREIKILFNSSYEFEKDATYTASFDVKANSAAQAYANSQSASSTNVPTNATSGVDVSYTLDGTDYSYDYDEHPTIPITKEETPTSYTITGSVVHGTMTIGSGDSFSSTSDTASTDSLSVTGGNVTVRYAAQDGYAISSVTVDGESVSITDYPTGYTFTDVNGNHTIDVVYEPISNPSDSTNGVSTITVNKVWHDASGNVIDAPSGTTVTVNVNDSDGTSAGSITLNADSWTGSLGGLSSSKTYSIEEEAVSGYTASYSGPATSTGVNQITYNDIVSGKMLLLAYTSGSTTYLLTRSGTSLSMSAATYDSDGNIVPTDYQKWTATSYGSGTSTYWSLNNGGYYLDINTDETNLKAVTTAPSSNSATTALYLYSSGNNVRIRKYTGVTTTGWFGSTSTTYYYFRYTGSALRSTDVSSYATSLIPYEVTNVSTYTITNTAKDTSGTDPVNPDNPTTSTAPEHHKSISGTGTESDPYTLSLNVTGKSSSSSSTSTSGNKVDVVLVVDVSGSMSGTKISNIKSAANSLVTTLLGSGSTVDAQMALVEFGGGYNNGYMDDYNLIGSWSGSTYDDAKTDVTWTSSSSAMTSGISGLSSTYSSTNVEAGLRNAATILSSARTDATKVVVLLSDGQPNIYYNSQGYSPYSSGNETAAINAAYAQADAMVNTVDAFYTVATGSDDDMSFLSTIAGKFTTHASYTATDSSGLTSAFNSIGQSITTTSTKKLEKVTITDTLTDYVDFVTKTGNYGVTVTDSNGNTIAASNYTVSVSGKTITITFDDDFDFENGVTYTASFAIEPTQEAYTATNNASANTSTFNTNTTAKIDYTYGGTTGSDTYAEEPTITLEKTSTPLTGMIYGKDGRAILLTLLALALLAAGGFYYRKKRRV